MSRTWSPGRSTATATNRIAGTGTRAAGGPATGAVLSNFPARGQGKVFLINDIEVATAQLWVHKDQGIKSFADLKGKRIATTTGTTAHVFLDRALRANSRLSPTTSAISWISAS